MGDYLTADELTELQAYHEASLPDTCSIYAAVETNTKGSVAVTWPAATYTGIACRVMPVRAGQEYVTGDKVTNSQAYWLTLPVGQVINAGDRVVHGGVTYQVTVIPTESHTYRTAVRVQMAVVE